jgi:hypothetical protein
MEEDNASAGIQIFRKTNLSTYRNSLKYNAMEKYWYTQLTKETSKREENTQLYRGFYLLSRVVPHYLLYGVVLHRAGRFDLEHPIP